MATTNGAPMGMTREEQRRWVHSQRMWDLINFVRAAGSKPGTYTLRYGGDSYVKVTVPAPKE